MSAREARITGRFTFANAHCLEVGLDAYTARCHELDGITFDGTAIRFDLEYAATARVHAETVAAVEALASFAKAGSVTVVEASSRRRLGHGKRSSSAGLPPQHRRWEVYLAAAAGATPVLRKLHAAGVALDVRFAGLANRSALHAAAASGSVSAIGLLLDAGLAVNAVDTDGVSPLALAANAKAARRLLAAGADPGGSCLDLADEDGRTDVILALLEAGAQPSIKLAARLASRWLDTDRATLAAIAAHNAGLAKGLREPAVMARAIASGDAAAIAFVQRHGASLPEDTLSRAVEAGSIPLVRKALRMPNAAHLCGPSSGRDDAMCVAAARGDLAMMKLLERHGVPLQPAIAGETSPIHEAALASEHDCVAWLVKRGVPIDALNAANETALHRVFRHGWVEDSARLVQLGADPRGLDRPDLRHRQRERLVELQALLARSPARNRRRPR